jgi:adenylylsulfate kinase
MTTGSPVTALSAIVAFSEAAPRQGTAYWIFASREHVSGKITSLEVLDSDPKYQQGLSQSRRWSRLASIQLEILRSAVTALLPVDRSYRIELRDDPTSEPIAVGLAVSSNRAIQHPPRETAHASPGLTIWLTGLSGAGKTTIACELERTLRRCGQVEMLDADTVRTHICKGLGFTEEDRMENVRRLAVLARMLAESGAIVLVSAISPYRAARNEARSMVGRFIEVYVNAPLSVCERRDVKGLYKRARSGEIKQFTGIDDPYEPPIDPEVECRTDIETVEESVSKVVAALAAEGRLMPDPALTNENGPL